MEAPNLLLIGGSGFIGRHIAARALSLGFDSTLVGRNPDPELLAELGPRARLMNADAFSRAEGDGAIRAASAIVYLVSQSVPISSADMLSWELDENVRPAFDIFLRIASLNPSARLVLISSGGTVYGETAEKPTPEDTPLRPISPYGLGKVMIEQIATFCATTRAQPVAILRVANPVGRFHRRLGQGLVPAVIRAIAANRPIEVFGDGTQVRDYLDADDVADAVLRVVGVSVKERPLGVWNVGSGRGLSVREVIELVYDVVGRPVAIEWRPPRRTDVACSILDISRIDNEVGWRPTTPLRRSVEKVVEATMSRT